MDKHTTATGVCPPDDLLSKLDLMSEDQLAALAKVKNATAEAWRKRNEGPPWVRIGNAVYYPIPGARDFLQKRVRVPAGAAVHVL